MTNFWAKSTGNKFSVILPVKKNDVQFYHIWATKKDPQQ
jgi:hypothetical protein